MLSWPLIFCLRFCRCKTWPHGYERQRMHHVFGCVRCLSPQCRGQFEWFSSWVWTFACLDILRGKVTPNSIQHKNCWWPVDCDILDIFQIFGPQIHDYTWLYNIIHAHCVPMSLRRKTHILTILGLQTSVWAAKQHIQVEHIYIYTYIYIQCDSTRVFVLVVLSRTRSFRNVLSESKRTKPLNLSLLK